MAWKLAIAATLILLAIGRVFSWCDRRPADDYRQRFYAKVYGLPDD